MFDRRMSRRDLLSAAALAAGSGLCCWPGTAAGQGGQVDWLDEVQRPPHPAVSHEPPLTDLLLDGEGRRITSLDDWKRRRRVIRQTWLDYLKPLEARRIRPRLEVIEEDRPDGCIRQLVRYESEPDETVEGYLIKPTKHHVRPRPGVVTLHSTVPFTIRQPAGLEGKPEVFFGLELAKRGVVTFSPRCFLWSRPGSYQQQVERFQRRHPASLGMAKMLWDAMRAVDVLASLPEVDPQRLGAVGHSLGAKETLYLAAFDRRIKVAVASEGGIGTTFSNWDATWYLGPAIRDGTFRHEHHELLALAAPRALLLLGGDSADGERSWPYITAALPVYRLHGSPARIGLFNHRAGHAVPPTAERRIHEWFDAYL